MITAIQALRFTGENEKPTALQFIRRAQRVPAILSGWQNEEQILSLDAEGVEQAIGDNDEGALVRLDVEGEIICARVSDVDRDMLKHTIWYVELTRLPDSELVAVDVPVEVHSKSGLFRNGVVVQHLESVRVEGPVEVLPEVVHIDARHLLRPDESITLTDLKLPRGCQVVGIPLETPVVTIQTKMEAAKVRAPAK